MKNHDQYRRHQSLFCRRTATIQCASLDRMVAVLRDLHSNCQPEEPICATVEIPHYQIHLGLGADPTFVMINVEPYDGEYYMSVGDTQAEGDVGFLGCGNWTSFERRNFIPFSTAVAVTREFVSDRRRSGAVRWENWDQQPV